jgi:hypothetical protein
MTEKQNPVAILQSNIERAIDRLTGDRPAPMDYTLAYATLLQAQAMAVVADELDSIRWMMSNDPRRA